MNALLSRFLGQAVEREKVKGFSEPLLDSSFTRYR